MATSNSTPYAKALPPHLREKKPITDEAPMKPKQKKAKAAAPVVSPQLPKQDCVLSTPSPRGAKTQPITPPYVSDILSKLTEHGIQVGEPQPIKARVVADPGPEEDEARSAGGNEWLTVGPNKRSNRHPQSLTTEAQRGGTLGRGRGHGRGRGRGRNHDRQPRESRWVKKSDIKTYPRRRIAHRDDSPPPTYEWASGWEAPVDSDWAAAGCFEANGAASGWAQSGWNGRTHELANWDGSWAMPPINWEGRAGFSTSNSSRAVNKWLDRVVQDMCDNSSLTMRVAEEVGRSDSGEHELEHAAPQYWLTANIGNQALQALWVDVLSSQPKPIDEDDLAGATPWWEQFVIEGGDFLKPLEPPSIAGIDSDEDDIRKLARENDYGTLWRCIDAQKAAQKAKRDANRERRKMAQERAQARCREITWAQEARRQADLAGTHIKTSLQLSVRMARAEDISRIREIYNYYVTTTISASESLALEHDAMLNRFEDITGNLLLPFLVACECTAKNKVVGFAYADDFNDPKGMYRFATDIEVFVDRQYCQKGVASCLMDELISLLDGHHMPNGGYEPKGIDIFHGQRALTDIIVHFAYASDDPNHLQWIQRWLCDKLEFKKVGEFEGIGIKVGKSVNLAMFQRKTGTRLDPMNPPIMMS